MTIRIYQETTQTVNDYVTLSIGIGLIAAGSILGIIAVLKLGKRAFLTAIALAMITSGICLTFTYSSIIHNEEIISTKTIVIPAEGYTFELARFNSSGTYIFSSEDVTFNASLMTENSFIAWLNGNEQTSWANHLYYEIENSNLSATYVLVFSNQNATEATATYRLYHAWDEYNYVGLIGGIVLMPAGIAIFYLTNKTQIKHFNKALNEQTKGE